MTTSGSAPPGPVSSQWSIGRTVVGGRVLGAVTKVCALVLVVVALITALFVAAFGHAAVWATVGAVFAFLPFLVLVLSLGVRWRAAVATGPGWVGMRVVRRWRTVPVGPVHVVRVGGPAGDARRHGSDAGRVIDVNPPALDPGPDGD